MTREVSSVFKHIIISPVHSFSPVTPTPRACTQLPLTRYRLHFILKNGRGNERQFHCLRFLCSSRQVDCERKNRQLSDLYVLTKSLVQIYVFVWLFDIYVATQKSYRVKISDLHDYHHHHPVPCFRALAIMSFHIPQSLVAFRISTTFTIHSCQRQNRRLTALISYTFLCFIKLAVSNQ